MAGKAAQQKIVVLYDRMKPVDQAWLIDRFVRLNPDRLVELTALRVVLDKRKLKV